MEYSTIDTEIIEKHLGEDRVREARWFEDEEDGGLATTFAGGNGLIDVTADHEDDREADWTSKYEAFVVTEDEVWCIFPWSLSINGM